MKKNISKILIMLVFIAGAFLAKNVLAVPLQPTLSLYVNIDLTSTSIPYNGSVQITWRPTNAISCLATGGSSGWAGDLGLGGDFITGPLTATTTYSMTCSGGLGTTPVTKSVKVTVGTVTPPAGSIQQQSDLSVYSDDPDNITYTTAILKGHMNAVSSPTIPITAYFRYSKANISPIFCNDIYGTDMISTKDIFLGTPSSTSFYQSISNLSPDTTYYYCAIISNKNNIVYGGTSIVKSFRTNPYQTTVKTIGATSIGSDSAILNGSVSSVDNVATYFQYKKASTIGTSNDWGNIQLCKTTYTKAAGAANIYKNLSCDLSKVLTKIDTTLDPNTNYQFRAVGTNTIGKETKTTYGSTLSFTTSPIGTSDQGGIGAGPNNPNNPNNPNTRTCPTNWTGIYPNCIPPTTSLLCPSGWTGIYPNCTGPGRIGTCPTGWTGTYPDCIGIIFNPQNPTNPNNPNNPGNPSNPNNPGNFSNPNNGVWGSTVGTSTGNKTSGTWGTGTGSGTWTATSGTGGTGTVAWSGTGNSGTWTSSTGSGTWTATRGIGPNGTNGTLTNLALGQTATAPNDAIVRFHEGIETVFTRQIIANPIYQSTYGYQTGADLQTFAWDLSDQFARMFGYVNSSGKEIRVSLPDIAAYQLQLVGNNLTVYEYYDGKIVDVRNFTTVFKNASDYEYYFKK